MRKIESRITKLEDKVEKASGTNWLFVIQRKNETEEEALKRAGYHCGIGFTLLINIFHPDLDDDSRV